MKIVDCIVIILSLISASNTEGESSCSDPNYFDVGTSRTSRLDCGPAFKNRCHCHRKCYESKHQFIVNCTDSKFNDAVVLSQLPNKTQVLIFTGNNIPELPWNVFGDMDMLPELRVIDMSNNKISEIPGKAYHHVKNVERLILDFNELSITPTRNHPRLFSNFVSLLELHLTDAFEDGPPRSLAETLHDIFVNSNLTKLIKLHLEQNEISTFHEKKVFCDLPSLLDLHLGDNKLNEIHFDLSCLKKLRFLDLQRNSFKTVSERDLRMLDLFPERNQSLTVDFSLNPFECSCALNSFVKWMETTKVEVRNKGVYTCKLKDKTVEIHVTEGCEPVDKLLMMRKPLSGVTEVPTVLLYMLSLLLMTLVFALVYLQRKELQKKLGPVFETVNKRVYYTSISTRENRDADV